MEIGVPREGKDLHVEGSLKSPSNNRESLEKESSAAALVSEMWQARREYHPCPS